ncbi:MAG: YceI family protein [Bryobacteraceae bacterium]
MIAPQPNIGVTRYLVDKSASTFLARAFASGMLSALGHSPTIAIRDFTSEASLDPDSLESVSLRIEIRADSLEVMDDISAKDRREMESTMNEKVLESAKYPTILFQSDRASATKLGGGRFKAVVDGTLSLRGTAGKIAVPTQVTLIGDMLRASGEFSILQSSYGIPLVSVAGGALKLKDEVKFTFDIVARMQE